MTEVTRKMSVGAPKSIQQSLDKVAMAFEFC
jgi:hypothetical protein